MQRVKGHLKRLYSARILQHLCMIKSQTKCPLDNCYSPVGKRMSKSLIILPTWREAITYQASGSNASGIITSLLWSCIEPDRLPSSFTCLYHRQGASRIDRQGQPAPGRLPYKYSWNEEETCLGSRSGDFASSICSCHLSTWLMRPHASMHLVSQSPRCQCDLPTYYVSLSFRQIFVWAWGWGSRVLLSPTLKWGALSVSRPQSTMV